MNNNLKESSHARCNCGRYATIGEWKAGIGLDGLYTCPDCLYREAEERQSRKYNEQALRDFIEALEDSREVREVLSKVDFDNNPRRELQMLKERLDEKNIIY